MEKGKFLFQQQLFGKGRRGVLVYFIKQQYLGILSRYMVALKRAGYLFKLLEA